MRKYLFSPRILILGLLAAVLAAVPAQAATGVFDTSECEEHAFEQPFLSVNDSNWYTLFPGQSESGFEGEGWELSGGAQIVTTTLAGGSTGTVLDLPSGAKAVSPRYCVMSNYPTARARVMDATGQEGVAFQVSYEGKKTWENPRTTGQLIGWPGSWTVSPEVKLAPPKKLEGWEPMKITLVGNGTHSEYQIYDLYLDPRLSH